MTVRDLIHLLLDYPPDSLAYISKGVGPVGNVTYEVKDGRYFVIVEPVK